MVDRGSTKLPLLNPEGRISGWVFLRSFADMARTETGRIRPLSSTPFRRRPMSGTSRLAAWLAIERRAEEADDAGPAGSDRFSRAERRVRCEII